MNDSEWAKNLAAHERHLMQSRKVQEAVTAFMKRTSFSERVVRVRLYQYYQSEFLGERPVPQFMFYGRCGLDMLPYRAGDEITIPKGVLIHGDGVRMKGGVTILGKTRTIVVESVFPGRDLHPDTEAGDYMNPRLRWIGLAGAHCEVDINHVLVANSYHGEEAKASRQTTSP